MITTVLGGIGLFLLGMVLLTEGLRAAAGDALRRILTRLTGGPATAFASGFGITALVQSSSATTLATIGFVSAGLLTFPQAVGVIFGANVGTTSTGWIVSVLGLKLNVAAAALPLVGVGALLRLLTRGRSAQLGLALAGFGLIFVGIDTLQSGMSALATRIDPSQLPTPRGPGMFGLVLVGAAMTVILQSSSAAVAVTLTALHTGAIEVPQAAALVIGQNVGTTVTAGLASIGGSVPAKRTALAHVLFNVLTALIAVLFFPLFLALARALSSLLADGDAAGIAAFHTAFNLAGVALLLPIADRYARFVERLVPEREPSLTRNLDPSVASVAPVAVEAARNATMASANVMAAALVTLLGCRGRPSSSAVHDAQERLAAVDVALDEIQRFLGRVRSSSGSAVEHDRHLGVLHAIDHLERLGAHARSRGPARVMEQDPSLRALVVRLCGALERSEAWLAGREEASPLADIASLAAEVAAERRAQRPQIMEETASGARDPELALRQLDAMRWVDRVTYQWWRAVHHLSGATQEGSGSTTSSDTPEPAVASSSEAASAPNG